MSTQIAERAPRRWLLLGVLLTAPFMAQADVTIVNVATPSVHADLGASGAALQLVVGLGVLAAVAAYRAARPAVMQAAKPTPAAATLAAEIRLSRR